MGVSKMTITASFGGTTDLGELTLQVNEIGSQVSGVVGSLTAGMGSFVGGSSMLSGMITSINTFKSAATNDVGDINPGQLLTLMCDLIDSIGSIIQKFRSLMNNFLDYIKSLLLQALEVILGIVAAIASIVSEIFGIINQILSKITGLIDGLLDMIKDFGLDFALNLSLFGAANCESLAGVIDAAYTDFEGTVNKATDTAKDAVNNIVTNTVSKAKKRVNDMTNNIVGDALSTITDVSTLSDTLNTKINNILKIRF